MTKYVVFWNVKIYDTDKNLRVVEYTSPVVQYNSEAEAVNDFWSEALECANHWPQKGRNLNQICKGIEIWAEVYDSNKHDWVMQ